MDISSMGSRGTKVVQGSYIGHGVTASQKEARRWAGITRWCYSCRDQTRYKFVYMTPSFTHMYVPMQLEDIVCCHPELLSHLPEGEALGHLGHHRAAALMLIRWRRGWRGALRPLLIALAPGAPDAAS